MRLVDGLYIVLVSSLPLRSSLADTRKCHLVERHTNLDGCRDHTVSQGGLRVVFPGDGDGVISSARGGYVQVQVAIEGWKSRNRTAQGRLCFDVGAERQCPSAAEAVSHTEERLLNGTVQFTELQTRLEIYALLVGVEDEVLARSAPVQVEILMTTPMLPSIPSSLEPILPRDAAHRRKFLPIESPWQHIRKSECISPGEGTNPLLAIGVISSMRNARQRQAIRDTWLSSLTERFGVGVVQYRFFVGILSITSRQALSGELVVPWEAVREIETYGDVVVMAHEDTYASVYHRAVGIFHWGVKDCNADFVMRANDDIYVALDPLVAHMSRQRPFSIYMGYFISDALVCRPDSRDMPGSGTNKMGGGSGRFVTGRKGDKSLCFSVSHYPADNYPKVFAQGNAIILSGDIAEMQPMHSHEPINLPTTQPALTHLALPWPPPLLDTLWDFHVGGLYQEVGAIVDKPWRAPMPDDVTVAMVAYSRGAAIHSLSASWSPDESAVACQAEAVIHFDLDTTVMRRMHWNLLAGEGICTGVERWRE